MVFFGVIFVVLLQKSWISLIVNCNWLTLNFYWRHENKRKEPIFDVVTYNLAEDAWNSNMRAQ